jgi:hypothetical protein
MSKDANILLYALRSLAVTRSLFRVASLVIWKVSLTFLMRHFEIKKSPVFNAGCNEESVKFTKIKTLSPSLIVNHSNNMPSDEPKV